MNIKEELISKILTSMLQLRKEKQKRKVRDNTCRKIMSRKRGYMRTLLRDTVQCVVTLIFILPRE